MIAPNPAYLLFCNSSLIAQNEATRQAHGTLRGRWHFVLERIDRPNEKLEAVDTESVPSADRLSLLCVVRGLEALEGPSRVNLVTTSRYVNRGLRFGLSNWRETGYTWERFGVQKPVRNADLWKRVAVALDFHDVDCRLLNTAVMAAGEEIERATDENEFAMPVAGESAPLSEREIAPVAIASRTQTTASSLDRTKRPGEALRRLCRRTRTGFVAPSLHETKETLRGIAGRVGLQSTPFEASSLAGA